MPVTTNPSQGNTDTNGTPVFQDWGPQPAQTTVTYSTAYPLIIVPPTIVFQIKDVIGTPLAQPYVAFRLKAQQTYFNTAVPFVTPASLAGNGYPNSLGTSVPIVANGLSFSFTPQFQNLSIITTGNYELRHWFYIQGQTAGGDWQDMAYYMHAMVLQVTNFTVSWSPNSLAFVYPANTPAITKEIVLTGNSWSLRTHNNKVALSSLDSGVTITPNTTNAGATASGSGTKTIQVTFPSDDFEPSEAFDGDNLTVLVGTSVIAYPWMSFQLINQNTFNVTPDSLSFQAVKGIIEASPQDLTLLLTEGTATVTKSPWINIVDAVVTIDEVDYPVKRVTVLNSANLEAGTYEGFINFAATINSIPSNINVPVTYVVQDFISSPYNGNAFTLDPLFYDLATQNPSSYFEVNTTIKSFKFFNDQEKTTIIPEKFPLFNKQGKFNLGKKIHQIMDRFPSPNENYQQYKPAEVVIEINERSTVDDSVIRSTFTNVQLFVAGISDNITANYPFLDVNNQLKRVTKQSFQIINMLLPNSPFQLDVYKNNQIHQSITLPLSGGKTVSHKLAFAAFNQGDIIKCVLLDLSAQLALISSQEFVVFPDNDFSQMVVWENEFLLQSALEFTGAFAVKNEFEMISQSVYENLVDVLKYLETRKKSTFTINTGWMLQSQERTIESLMRSQRAWILFNNEWISVVPISKSLPTYSSETDLYSYNIEFHINRSSDEKAYTY